MTPPLACLPVCMTFVGLAIFAAVVMIFDVANRVPGDDLAAPGGEADSGKSGPPPVWVMLLMVVAIAAVMLALAWYWPE